ncbi:RNA-processing protein [Candidatus Woesearchaeota archaeon]|nr:RNA-processing protein [Candidatus Woesearchaeota archaeon]
MASKDMNSELGYELKIPKDRVAVLIGKKGETKKHLEAITKTRIDVDSKEGDVSIKGKDALGMYTAKEVVRAIGRGFNPEIAQLLLKQDYSFELLNLADYSKTKNDATRLKGRVIGEKGKSRNTIEDLTGAYLSVYGKTIAIIGEISAVGLARRAVESLLSGSPHANVYKWLEKQRRNLRKKEMMELF